MSDKYEVVDYKGGDRPDYILRNGKALNIYGAKEVIESQKFDIDKLTEQNNMLRGALIRVFEWDNMSQKFRIDNGSRGQQRVIVGIAKEALEANK